MDYGSILHMWQTPKLKREASLNLWNHAAEQYNQYDSASINSSLALRVAEAESMISSRSEILDVGCGTGRFTIAMAKQAGRVHGTDLSPNMIGFSEENARKAGLRNITFSCDDWQEVNIKEKGWYGKFDFVLANMVPAVQSAESFLKLLEASRKWCLMVKPGRRTDSIYDGLEKLLGKPNQNEILDQNIIFAFSLLWYKGLNPRVEYEKKVFSETRLLDEAVQYYINRLETRHELKKEDKQMVEDYLKDAAAGHEITETTVMTLAAIYCRVDFP